MLEVVLSSSRRVRKGPGRRPQSAKRQRFMELRERGWSILAAAREVGVSRTTGNNWSRGYKTYRHGQVVGLVPALERLAVRQISSRWPPPRSRSTSATANADASYKLRLREELGDVLWYVATLANKFDLNLDEIAAANLDKTRSRWLPGSHDRLDAAFPASEQLPRQGTYTFVPADGPNGYPQVRIYFDGQPVGDPLTDNSASDDGYRFHDIFHFAYTTFLDWSPVTRALLRRKRKSDPATDEQEDGGRAIVAEEGLSLFAFAYGAQHNHLAGIHRLDQQLLDGITLMTSGLEVSTRTHADFETAILEGHRVYRLPLEHNGGTVDFDADLPSLTFRAHPNDGPISITQ